MNRTWQATLLNLPESAGVLSTTMALPDKILPHPHKEHFHDNLTYHSN
jgi:hypothetical protein